MISSKCVSIPGTRSLILVKRVMFKLANEFSIRTTSIVSIMVAAFVFISGSGSSIADSGDELSVSCLNQTKKKFNSIRLRATIEHLQEPTLWSLQTRFVFLLAFLILLSMK